MHKRNVCLISLSPILSDMLVSAKSGLVGGAEVQQTLIMKMLQDLDYGVTVLVHDLGQPDEMHTQDGLRLLKAFPRKAGVGSLLTFCRHPLWVAMKRADADMFYQRMGGSMTGVFAFLCRLLGRPFAFSTSSDMDLDGVKERSMNRIKQIVYRYGIRSAAAVIVQTDQQNSDLRRRFGREGVVVRNTYSVSEEGANREHRYIIWVGSFRDLKRPEMFLELASRIPDQEFLMIGGTYMGQPTIFEEMQKRAAAIPNITLTGMVPYEEVGALFDKAKILVCTSTVEGFPNTFLQAWSRGIPVVATVDPDELIQRLDLGRFCTTMDEIVEAVRKLSSDDALHEAIGIRAKAYVNENHHPNAVRARYKELIGSLIRRTAV